jgi:hypothetical protein
VWKRWLKNKWVIHLVWLGRGGYLRVPVPIPPLLLTQYLGG